MRSEMNSILVGTGPESQPHGSEPGGSRYVIPRSDRTVTLLMLGRLTHHGGDTICRIRNVSSGGLRIETGSPLNTGDMVSVEGRSGVSIDGRVAWADNLVAGIAFSQSIDEPEILSAPTGPSGARLVARSPRFKASARVRLDCGARAMKLRLIDISLGGCRVESDGDLPREIEGRLTVPGLAPIECASRWISGTGAGLIFPTKLVFADFARWLERSEFRFGSGEAAKDSTPRYAFRAPGSPSFTRPRNS